MTVGSVTAGGFAVVDFGSFSTDGTGGGADSRGGASAFAHERRKEEYRSAAEQTNEGPRPGLLRFCGLFLVFGG